jgi:hypothetical protein
VILVQVEFVQTVYGCVRSAPGLSALQAEEYPILTRQLFQNGIWQVLQSYDFGPLRRNVAVLERRWGSASGRIDAVKADLRNLADWDPGSRTWIRT